MSRAWFGRKEKPGSARAAGTSVPLGAPVAAAHGTYEAGTREPGASAGWATEQPLLTIDALGRKCPIPIIMLAERIGDVPVGAVVAVLADDPAAYTDIPAWAAMKSHECVSRIEYATGWSFGIRRSY